MATSNKNQGRAAGPATKGLKVTARPASFRRAGHTFSGEAKTIPLADLTEQQVEQIKSDPNLVWQEVDIEEPKDSDQKAADPKA